MNKEKMEWTIEGLTQLRNIMNYSMIQGSNIYIESPLNFIKALDNALELLQSGQESDQESGQENE